MGNARAAWLDYLRSFVTLLVVAHHAALAYPTFAHFDPTHYIYSTAPVVDTSRWAAMDIFNGFNDVFFMALMFFISGLFVYRGLTKKGPNVYLADRLIRLGTPFVFAELLLIPLAYLPSFYLATHSTDLTAFIRDYILTQQWPVGPPWFIWLLLAFDGLSALIFRLSTTFFPSFGAWLIQLSHRPARLCAAVYGLIALSLIPLSLWVGQYTWVGNWGPFDFQLNRVLFYFLFFVLGVSLGTTDWQAALFKDHKLLAVDWSFWVLLSLGCYVFLVLISRAGADWVTQGKLTGMQGYFLYDLAFVTSCLASICACLAVFRQKITHPFGNWVSLSANAYGIYLIHYGFVTWLQFALLPVNLPVVMKFILVFLGALGLSWLGSSLIRRSPLLASIL
ncbi:acyltransferase family protein [Spirosoma koreense]